MEKGNHGVTGPCTPPDLFCCSPGRLSGGGALLEQGEQVLWVRVTAAEPKATVGSLTDR